MEIPTVTASFCWSLPICKKSDVLFWITLNTPDHFHLRWLKVLLLLLSYNMQKTNFIYNSTHSWDKTDSLFVVTLDMFKHAWAHPLEAANWYLVLSRTSNHIQKFNFIPQFFCEIFWFKESYILRFLGHNSRTRFLQTCCFGKKYKKTLALRAEVRKHI